MKKNAGFCPKKKLKGQKEDHRKKHSLKLLEENEYDAMDQLLSPKNSSFTKKKIEIKLLRSMKMRKGGSNSRSISPNQLVSIKSYSNL